MAKKVSKVGISQLTMAQHGTNFRFLISILDGLDEAKKFHATVPLRLTCDSEADELRPIQLAVAVLVQDLKGL
jgi:hypothetical protein